MQRSADWPQFLTAMLRALMGLWQLNGHRLEQDGEETSMQRVEFYWDMLEDLPCEDVLAGLQLACRYVTRGFPYPGVIREHAEQARRDRLATAARKRQLAERRLLAEGGDHQALGLAQVQAILQQLGARMEGEEMVN